MGSNRKTLRLDSLENDPVLKEWLLSDLLSEGGLDMESADSLLDVNAITLELPPGERWPEGMDGLLEELRGGAAATEEGGKAPQLKPDRQLSAKHEVLRALVRGDRSFSRTLSQELNDQLSGLRSASATTAGSPRSPLGKKRRREGTGLAVAASAVEGNAVVTTDVNHTQTVSDDAPSMEEVFASIERDRARSTAQSTLRAPISRAQPSINDVNDIVMSISPSGNLAIQLPSTPASSMPLLPSPRFNGGGGGAAAATSPPSSEGGSMVGPDQVAGRPSARQEKLEEMLRRLREVLPALQVGTSGKVAASASPAINPTTAVPSPSEVIRQAKHEATGRLRASPVTSADAGSTVTTSTVPTVTTNQHAILMRAQNELMEAKARHKQRKLELMQQRSATAPAGIPPSLVNRTASSQGFQAPTTSSSGAHAAGVAPGAAAGAGETPRGRLEKQDSIMWTAALSKATEVLVDKPDTIAMVGAAMTRHRRKQKEAAAAAAAAAAKGGSSLSASQPPTMANTLPAAPYSLPGLSMHTGDLVTPVHAKQPLPLPAVPPSLCALPYDTNNKLSPSNSAMSTDVPLVGSGSSSQRATAAATSGGAEAEASTRRAERKRVLKGKADLKRGGSGAISPAVSTDTLLGKLGSGVGSGAVEEALHIEIDDLKAKLKSETTERTKQVRSLEMRLKHMHKQDSQKSLQIEELQAKYKALQGVNLQLRTELERARAQLIEETTLGRA